MDRSPWFNVGVTVEVRGRFEGWCRGFVVAHREEGDDERYRVRRVSDGMELPETFAEDDLRVVPEPIIYGWRSHPDFG